MQQGVELLIKTALENGADAARPLAVSEFVYDPRAELKCRFGCARWGKYWTCPPNIGFDRDFLRQAMDRYENALILRSPDRESGQNAALAVEKAAMLKHGMTMAMALTLCVKCDPCAYPEPCIHPEVARPALDGLGYDVVKTAAKAGFEVKFAEDGSFIPAWFTAVILD